MMPLLISLTQSKLSFFDTSKRKLISEFPPNILNNNFRINTYELDIDCINNDRDLIANIENSHLTLLLLTDYCDAKRIRIIAEGIESKSLINYSKYFLYFLTSRLYIL